MKNLQLVLTSLLLMIAHLSMAQLEKGTTMIGGTAGFDLQFEEGDNLFTLTLNPSIAVFTSNNLAIGSNLGLTYLKSGDFSTTFLNLLPFARYYFLGGNEKSVIFLEGKIGLALASFDNGGGSESESAFQYAFGPGVSFFLTDNVSIDAILAYNHIGGDFDQSSFGLNIGLQAFLFKGGE
ncbi:MAG: opacity protein-like surface antigen [Saprospiraceae bacterium]|jgi:opacity protein-like surface antigen